jgi:hypothetical protein
LMVFQEIDLSLSPLSRVVVNVADIFTIESCEYSNNHIEMAILSL